MWSLFYIPILINAKSYSKKKYFHLYFKHHKKRYHNQFNTKKNRLNPICFLH